MVDRSVRHFLEHRDEPAGIGVGRRTDQHRVDDGEHGGVGADADGERGHGDGREAGTAPQAAQAVPHVLAQQIEMFARRRRQNAAYGIPPQRHVLHDVSSSESLPALIAKRLRHLLAEVAAEFGGEEVEQAFEDAIGS